MKYLYLFYSILKNTLVVAWRYKLDAICGVFFMTVMCMLILFGFTMITKSNPDSFNKISFIGGYILWIILMTNYQIITATLENETSLGTLEQLYINTSNILTFFLLKCISFFIYNTFFLYLIIIIISLLAKIQITLNIIMMLPIIILGIPALWSVSLGVGSLILVFKRISVISSVISMLVISFMPYIVQKSRIVSLIVPFGLANKLAQDIFKNKIKLSDVSNYDIIYILLNNLFYIIMGVIIYKVSERFAKKHGKLAQH